MKSKRRQEVETEVDRGVISFLETLTAWIIIGFLGIIIFIPIIKLIVKGP